MSVMMRIACICLLTVPALCEPPKYEVATITDVKAHQAAETDSTSLARYDVSVKVADTTYVVLFTDTMGTSTIKYTGGRQLLVHVGKDTITYNDILGRSQELPILSRQPAAKGKPAN